MNYKIREIQSNEYELLCDFLYEAIFIPDGVMPPPKEIINRPELQVYISDFGRKKGDMGLIAEVESKIVGAVWVRIMNDYGHIDDETPSLAISLYADYRNLGIGTALMQEMLYMIKKEGYKQTSLAVQKDNYAVKMYEKAGFEIVDENEEDYIMICKFEEMIEIKTERLIIMPMRGKELLSLVNQYKITAPELSMAYQEMYDNCIKYPEHYLWHTAWRILLIDTDTEVGYAGFKGFNEGVVEIGYGLNDEYTGNGYATEAVEGLCKWAIQNPDIVAIEAETEWDNIKSQNVLINNGFIKTGVIGEEGPRYIFER